MNLWKVILAALVIFAAGVITGGVTVNLQTKVAGPTPVAPPRQPFNNRPNPAWTPERVDMQHRQLLHRLEERLDLTPEQHGRIEAMVRESRQRLTTMAQETSTHIRGELDQLRGNIRRELTPGQQRTFEEVFKPRPPKWLEDRQSRFEGGQSFSRPPLGGPDARPGGRGRGRNPAPAPDEAAPEAPPRNGTK